MKIEPAAVCLAHLLSCKWSKKGCLCNPPTNNISKAQYFPCKIRRRVTMLSLRQLDHCGWILRLCHTSFSCSPPLQVSGPAHYLHGPSSREQQGADRGAHLAHPHCHTCSRAAATRQGELHCEATAATTDSRLVTNSSSRRPTAEATVLDQL